MSDIRRTHFHMFQETCSMFKNYKPLDYELDIYVLSQGFDVNIIIPKINVYLSLGYILPGRYDSSSKPIWLIRTIIDMIGHKIIDFPELCNLLQLVKK